ncbi:hypothetical protein [Falsibacillus albus]|uniref:Uncharacterized protein n=1 Tax=Falsibacillus albus TaxID=2478915 RepID=A0A3L7K309_9BACI|nr:hypothetical protein [Falsibacillus albus]RLQ97466.1 hypothetical protein D9X91_04760 [Falsibacillus albus]
MKNSRWFLLGLLIVPWLTFPLLGKSSIKRFLPAVLIITVVTKIIDIIGDKRYWWKFYQDLPPIKGVDVFNLGPYFITSLWILKMTYQKFWLYVLTNVVVQYLFIFFGLDFLKKIGIVSLKKIPKLQYWAVDLFRLLLLYAFQMGRDYYTKKI